MPLFSYHVRSPLVVLVNRDMGRIMFKVYIVLLYAPYIRRQKEYLNSWDFKSLVTQSHSLRLIAVIKFSREAVTMVRDTNGKRFMSFTCFMLHCFVILFNQNAPGSSNHFMYMLCTHFGQLHTVISMQFEKYF